MVGFGGHRLAAKLRLEHGAHGAAADLLPPDELVADLGQVMRPNLGGEVEDFLPTSHLRRGAA